MVSEPMKDRVKRAYILPEAKHSDHCPIVVEIDQRSNYLKILIGNFVEN